MEAKDIITQKPWDKASDKEKEIAETSFKAKDKVIDTTIKAVLGQTPEHCNQHSKFADECMACHNVCNENIDFDLLDRLKEIKQIGIQEVVKFCQYLFAKWGVDYEAEQEWQAKLKEWNIE